MDHRQRGGMEERGHEVALAGRVDAVGHDARETQVARERLHVDGVGGTGNGTGTERKPVGLGARRVEPLVIAPQRCRMREKEMRDQHRLGRTEVCEGRHDRISGAGCLPRQRGDDALDTALHQRNAPPQVQAEIQGDLLVA